MKYLMNLQPDELIMLTGMIISIVLYVPFRRGAVRIRAVSRCCLSLPLFFLAWLLGASIFGLTFPHLGWEGMPAGFGAAIPSMMPGMNFIKWSGLFSWFSSHTSAGLWTYLISAAFLNFLLYWAVDFVGTSLYRKVSRGIRG